MALRARFSGRCTACGKPYPVGEQIERLGDAWVHAHCAAARSVRGATDPAAQKAGSGDGSAAGGPTRAIAARYPGECGLCGSMYSAGAQIERPGETWVHHGCMEQRRAELSEALDKALPVSRALQVLLDYVSLLWSDSTSLSTDVRVQRTGDNSWFLHTRPVIDRISGFVGATEFRRRAPEAYFPSCELLAELANDCFDGHRYPDEVSFPENAYQAVALGSIPSPRRTNR